MRTQNLTCHQLDRNSIAQARVYGLDKDTGTTGATWQTAISILSVGYVGKYQYVRVQLSRTDKVQQCRSLRRS